MESNTFSETEPAPTVPAAALTVYFDGACPVCSREIAAYRRQDGAERCAWVNAAACDDWALGPGLSRENALARFHVRRADGSLVDGMRGFAVLWQALPRMAWLGRLASWGPVPALLDGAYAIFLRLRPSWRRLVPASAGSAEGDVCPVRGDAAGGAAEKSAI